MQLLARYSKGITGKCLRCMSVSCASTLRRSRDGQAKTCGRQCRCSCASQDQDKSPRGSQGAQPCCCTQSVHESLCDSVSSQSMPCTSIRQFSTYIVMRNIFSALLSLKPPGFRLNQLCCSRKACCTICRTLSIKCHLPRPCSAQQ